MAQWYRKYKGKLFKFCTKHEADFARRHWGKPVDFSELDEDDIRYLEEKEHREEFAKKEPFEIIWFHLEDKVKIRDRRTGEWRSFPIKGTDLKRLLDVARELEEKESLEKLSIDDYVRKLKSRN